MAPAPRPGGAATPPTAGKVHKKERVLHVLTRMNDRDTQKAAAEELVQLVKNLDTEGLPILISCLCSTGSDQKVYARKECARALGVLASDACPLRGTALTAPHLGKLLGQARRALQDPDSSVRDAAAEAVAAIAAGLAAAGGGTLGGGGAGGAPPAAGNGTGPVLKLLGDCLAEQKKELNAAACMALGLAAPALGTLDAGFARELVRKAASPTFQAPAALLGAIARTDPATGEPLGLLRSGPAAFVPLLPALVGATAAAASAAGASPGASAGGSGALGALCRPDWPLRLAAADMLRACALLLGPLIEAGGEGPGGAGGGGGPGGLTGRAIRGLEACRFDKVRDVREAARSALAVLEELAAFTAAGGGGGAAGWPAHIAERLRARGIAPGGAAAAATPPLAQPKSPPRRTSPGRVSPARAPRPPSARARASPSPPPARRSPPPGQGAERRASPVFARAGSLSERFRAAHATGEMYVADRAGRYRPEEEEQRQQEQAEAAEAARAANGGGPGALARQASRSYASETGAPASQASANGAAGGGSRAVSRQVSQAASHGGPAGPSPALEPQASLRSRADSVRSQQQHDAERRSSSGGSAAAAVAAAAAALGGAAGAVADPVARRLGLEDAALEALDGSGGPPTFARQLSAASRASSVASAAPPSAAPSVARSAAPSAGLPTTPPSLSRAPSTSAAPAPNGLPRSDSARSAASSQRAPTAGTAASQPGTPPPAPSVAASVHSSHGAPAAAANGSPAPAATAAAAAAAVTAGAAAAAAHKAASAAAPGAAEWAAAQERLRSLEAQQRALLESLQTLNDSSGRAISGLQAKVDTLEAALTAAHAHLAAVGATPPGVSPSPSSSALALPFAPPVRVSASSPLRTPEPEYSYGSSSAAAWPPSRGLGLAGAAAAAGAAGGPAPGSPSASLGGGGSVAAGRLAAYEYESGGVVSPRVSLQMPASPPRASREASATSGRYTPPGGGLAAEASAGSSAAAPWTGGAPELRAAYREALAGARGGGASDMHLLRLLKRSGPVWNELGHELGCQLLAVFTASLQHARTDGPMLALLLPWLWRLADEDNNRFDAPIDSRAPLLAALRSALPAVADPTLHEKMSLLLPTLQTHWSMPDSPAATSRRGGAPTPAPSPPPPHERPPTPPSLGGGVPAASPGGGGGAAAALWGSPLHAHAQPGLPLPAAAAGVSSVQPPLLTEMPSAGSGSLGPVHSTVSITPTEPLSPVPAGPSLNTLMGQWSDLQRDYAAMASPLGRGHARGAA